MNDLATAVKDILAVGAASLEIRTIEGVPAIVRPHDYQVDTFEKLLLAPRRPKGKTTLYDAASFIAVVNEHKGTQTRLYSTVNPPTFTAVFNANVSGTTPGWGDHTAHYNAPLSPEWKTWDGKDGDKMTQLEFAQFIEQNLPDIVEPDGATLLGIANTLEAKKSVNFASGQRLGNGETQFVYQETIEGTAQQGAIKIPETFVLAIPVFENGEAWKLEARLRYRIAEGGKLSLWYELVRPHKTIEAAVKELRESIAKATEVSMLNGSPT